MVSYYADTGGGAGPGPGLVPGGAGLVNPAPPPASNINFGAPPVFGPPPTTPGMPTPLPYSSYATPNQGVLGQYSAMNPQSQAALGNVSSMARLLENGGQSLYGVGMPAYTAAANYYRQLLSGDQATATRAVGPQAEMIAKAGQGARLAVQGSNLQGGARDMALANIATQTGQQISDLIPAAISGAAQGAGSLGLSGATAGAAMASQGAGLSGTVAGAYQNQQQFGAQAEQANRFGAANLSNQATGLGIQAALGTGSLNLQSYLGAAGLALQNYLGSGQLQLGAGNLGVQQGQLALAQQIQPQELQLQQQQLAAQQQQAKWGPLGGALGQALPMFLGGLGSSSGGGSYLNDGSLASNGGFGYSSTGQT